jgi:hypothetical protein
MNKYFSPPAFLKSTLASLVLFFLNFFTVVAQPDYDFRNAVLVSPPGTENTIGAVYLFADVKTGVDAFVTITDISAGVSLFDIDAGSGYAEALQPTVNIAAGKKGYVELTLDFVYAGTSTPYLQTEIPVTCIDVDGNLDSDGLGNPSHEFDEINMGPGSYLNYSLTGFELTVTQSGDWYTGTNVAGQEYPGRDTSARPVMFTVVNANISTVILRVGVDNAASTVNTQRLRSAYFQKFAYTNGLLAVSPLRSFDGVSKNNTITINASFTHTNNIRGIELEKAIGNNPFVNITYMNNAIGNSFSFTDNAPGADINYYRLKITAVDGQISYSNLLRFNRTVSLKQAFKVYPGIIAANAAIDVHVDKAENALFQLVDLSGRTIFRQRLPLQAGNNTNVVTGLGDIKPGKYIAIVKTGGGVYRQQVIKQ